MAKKLSLPKGMKKLTPDKKSYGNLKTESVYDPRPDFSVDSAMLSEMDTWKVGEEYMLTIKVKFEDYSKSLGDDGKPKARGRFRIIAVGVEEDD